jgi:heptosyltransferase-1
LRILLIRTSALGDVVHCLPVLTALRRHFPQAHIGWLVEEAMRPVLAGHPDLDEIVTVRLRPWRRRIASLETLTEVDAFFAALDRFDADVALDLMGNHKAGFLARLSHAERRVGAARRHRREPSSAIWINETAVPRGRHAVDRALSLLDALGLPPEPADFGGDKIFRPDPFADLAGPPLAKAAARARLASGEPYVLIHPGAGWPNKIYPPAYWGRVAARIYEAAGLRTWVASNRAEEGLADALVAASRAADGTTAALAVPAPDLPTLAALLRGARLMMGGDSGPTHLAHALGTPVLMVMGPTDPERHGPYGAPERAVWKLLPCSFCYKRFDETKACLLDLPADRVAERALTLLQTP